MTGYKMAIRREDLASTWLLTGDIATTPYHEINGDGLWKFPITHFFSVSESSAVLITRAGTEVFAKQASWGEATSRYQRAAYVYISGSSKRFFIDMSELDVFQTILENEHSDEHHLSFYA